MHRHVNAHTQHTHIQIDVIFKMMAQICASHMQTCMCTNKWTGPWVFVSPGDMLKSFHQKMMVLEMGPLEKDEVM